MIPLDLRAPPPDYLFAIAGVTGRWVLEDGVWWLRNALGGPFRLVCLTEVLLLAGELPRALWPEPVSLPYVDSSLEVFDIADDGVLCFRCGLSQMDQPWLHRWDPEGVCFPDDVLGLAAAVVARQEA